MAPKLATIMNEPELSRMSGQYLAALRTHLDRGDPQADLLQAHEMGRLAVDHGLETLDLAKIHDLALKTLVPPDFTHATRDDLSTRAAIFFTEAITPIEETHRAAQEGRLELEKLNESLDQSALQLACSTRELRAGITERKTAEAALKSSELAFDQLLKESRLVEAHLKQMTHKILSAHEDERKRMSLQLQDEIAQTLLGIHVRLLALKKEAAANHDGLTEEIATTQRLVEDSVNTINRLTREFGIQHER